MFITLLKTEHLLGGRNVRLIAPLLWLDPLTGVAVGPPTGYVSNGASSPWWLWPFFRPWGKWSRAAVFHDWLIETGRVSKFHADILFYVMMVSDGVKWWKRAPAYIAVRYFWWLNG